MTADDHSMVRTGLQMMLELKFGLTNIVEAGSCAEILSTIPKQEPTHLITDMIFKDGNSIEILPAITHMAPDLHILVYSMLPPEVYLPALQKFGIRYYMHKEAPQQIILETIHNFLYSARQENLEAAPESTTPFSILSNRELEVLHYLLQGESVTYVAKTLNLHKNTISTLKARILEKIGVRNLKGLLDVAALHNYNNT